MDPNSTHQRWSHWVVTVDLPANPSHRPPQFQRAIEADAGRLFRAVFGSTGQVRVTSALSHTHERWIMQAQVEGADVHDPDFRVRTCLRLETHYRQGFGPSATVCAEAGMLAGSAEDGTPAGQWLILPTIRGLLTPQEA